MNVLRIDEHVGRRIRRRRRMLCMTQSALGQACGATFQQIHKYEVGECSMYATRLWRIANALELPPSYFFEGLRPDSETQVVPYDEEQDEAAELAHAFAALTETARRRLLTLARTLTEEHPVVDAASMDWAFEEPFPVVAKAFADSRQSGSVQAREAK